MNDVKGTRKGAQGMGTRLREQAAGVRLPVPFPAKPGLAGADDGLGAVGDLQLGEDVRDVVAYGLGAQVEAPGDLGVRLVACYEPQDLVLTLGELGEGVRW